jgi:hypothetical protein
VRGRLAACLCALTLLPAAGCGAGLARVTPGETLTDADLAVAWSRGGNREDADFSEQLVLRGALDGGGSVHVRFRVTNLAGADGRAQLSLTVKDGDGRRLVWTRTADRGAWQAGVGRFEVRLDGARLTVGVGQAALVIDEPGLQVDLRVAGRAEALRPAGGAVDRRGARYVTTIPVPRGALALTLTAPAARWARLDLPDVALPSGEGEAEPSAGVPAAEAPADLWRDDGVGFVEHRAGNIPPYALAQRWYNVASLGEDVTVVMSAFERPLPAEAPGGAVPEVRGFLFAADDDGLVLLAPEVAVTAEGFRPDDVTPYAYPSHVRVSEPRLGLRGVFALGPLSERTDDLAQLKKLERLIVRRFMQPWTFRFARARWLLRLQPASTRARDVRGEGTFLFQQVRP